MCHTPGNCIGLQTNLSEDSQKRRKPTISSISNPSLPSHWLFVEDIVSGRTPFRCGVKKLTSVAEELSRNSQKYVDVGNHGLTNTSKIFKEIRCKTHHKLIATSIAMALRTQDSVAEDKHFYTIQPLRSS